MNTIFEDIVSEYHKFPYKWMLFDGYPASNIEYHGKKVFSCFACGGGSTMGYKLAGYDVLGCNEIDKKMFELYNINHHPKYAYNEDIRLFKERNNLPDELYQLDILDGSPPCSSFSMSGNREKDWGKEKIFREGQSKQILDTLFYDFVDVAKKLQPKLVIAENVSGILKGNAYKYYYKKIHIALINAGYNVTAFLLNAKNMGVPQSRERVFVLGIRKDFPFPNINMNFYEHEILFKEIWSGKLGCNATERSLDYWNRTKPGKNFADVANGSWFNHSRLNNNKPMPTLTTETSKKQHLPDISNLVDEETIISAATFPIDYDFSNNSISYVCGMSVPPVMMAQISHRIYDQVLNKVL